MVGLIYTPDHGVNSIHLVMKLEDKIDELPEVDISPWSIHYDTDIMDKDLFWDGLFYRALDEYRE